MVPIERKDGTREAVDRGSSDFPLAPYFCHFPTWMTFAAFLPGTVNTTASFVQNGAVDVSSSRRNNPGREITAEQAKRPHPFEETDSANRNSIRRFGWTYPILADENLEIIAGFGRSKAAEHLGLQDVPVIIMAGLSDVEKRALALADNKIAANAGWDRTVLAAELGDLADLLPKCDLNIDITGFEPAEIDGLIGNLIDPEHDPAEELPAIGSTPVSRMGDLWLLSGHRLLCGKARSALDVDKLMGCETAAMLFTPHRFRHQS
jgi:hypothetical protein